MVSAPSILFALRRSMDFACSRSLFLYSLLLVIFSSESEASICLRNHWETDVTESSIRRSCELISIPLSRQNRFISMPASFSSALRTFRYIIAAIAPHSSTMTANRRASILKRMLIFLFLFCLRIPFMSPYS